MTSNFLITPLSRSSQAFHSSLRSHKRGKTNFNSASATARNKQHNKFRTYQDRGWRFEEGPGSVSDERINRTPKKLVYSDTQNGWAITNLSAEKLAQDLVKAIQKGFILHKPTIEIQRQDDGRFCLLFPLEQEYKYESYLTFKPHIECLVNKFFNEYHTKSLLEQFFSAA